MAKKISVVIPAYNEEKNIPLVSQAIVDVFSSLPYAYEIIFVNDGSSDNSLLELLRLGQSDHRIKCLDFSRNFGKESATSAGCHVAQGDAIITMDADLQHPPALILKFLQLWEQGAEVVYTVRKENKGSSWIKKIFSKLFYFIFNRVSGMRTESGSTDFRLMDKKVIEVFRKFPERERMFRGMIDWMGYKREKVEFVAPERIHGNANYSYNKLFQLALNSFTSFSLLPLRLAGYFGIFITFVSGLLLAIMLITDWFFNPTTFTPIAILGVSNMFLIGIVLISLGFIALYIARIHNEVINRPLYIVREKVNFDGEEKVDQLM
ncbi:MAG: glycosyltransferase family 2 protein [Candidatus Moranbacteria bacterium]|nr:glycosyltransferase family 2 protein [Candidatus Moranbacteria bacterium]